MILPLPSVTWPSRSTRSYPCSLAVWLRGGDGDLVSKTSWTKPRAGDLLMPLLSSAFPSIYSEDLLSLRSTSCFISPAPTPWQLSTKPCSCQHSERILRNIAPPIERQTTSPLASETMEIISLHSISLPLAFCKLSGAEIFIYLSCPILRERKTRSKEATSI